MIDFTLKTEMLGEVTVEEARKHQQFIDQVNYLIEEGFIQAEEGDDGQIRLYPT